MYGQKFTLLTDHKPLLTDHKPLLTIFNPRKGIPTVVASRLQRRAIILSAYTYDIQYKPTNEHGNADMLSRLPADPDSTFDSTQSLNAVVNMIQDEQLEHLPILTTDIQEATKDDNTLNYMQNGSKDKKAYFDHRHDRTIHNGCILRGLRVVIPQSLRERVLTEIHVSTCGCCPYEVNCMLTCVVAWPRQRN